MGRNKNFLCFKYNIESFKKFLSRSKYDLFVKNFLNLSPFKLILYYINKHQLDCFSKISISSLRHATFTFKLSRFINRDFKTTVSSKSFSKVKLRYVFDLSHKVCWRNISYFLNRCKNFFNISKENFFFTRLLEQFCYLPKLLSEEKSFLILLERIRFPYKEELTSKVFGTFVTQLDNDRNNERILLKEFKNALGVSVNFLFRFRGREQRESFLIIILKFCNLMSRLSFSRVRL